VRRTCRTDRRSAVRSSRLRRRRIVTDLDGLFDLVESDGFDVSGLAVQRELRSLLRKASDTGGQPLVDASTTQILGAEISYLAEGTFA
jgi:hypothetical protein